MLHYQTMGEGPRRWLLIAHGILGSGKNWRSFARALCRERPEWGAVLLDLRMHGESQDAAPPHTLDAAAGDVAEVAAAMRQSGEDVAGLLGHSFGGKVMMAARPRIADLQTTWIIDSSPSARPQDMQGAVPSLALRLLESLPRHFAERDEMVQALVRGGLAESVARWLALNLRRTGDGFELVLDLDALSALLRDYFVRDVWPELERGDGALHVALAGHDSSADAADRARFAELERRGVLSVHEYPESGHWIHVEARADLVAAVAASLD